MLGNTPRKIRIRMKMMSFLKDDFSFVLSSIAFAVEYARMLIAFTAKNRRPIFRLIREERKIPTKLIRNAYAVMKVMAP